MKLVMTAIAAFAATNLDDLFLLMMFFALTRDKNQRWAVVFGQYLGIAILVALSVVASSFIRAFPGQPERYLGFIPLAIGAVELMRAFRGKHDGHLSSEPESRNTKRVSVLSVMSFCLTDGADNLSIYIPLFARFPAAKVAVIALVFAVMTGIWCAAGLALGQMPPVRRVIRRWENVLVPVVMMAIGLMLVL